MSGPTQAHRKVTHGSLPCRHFGPSARKLMAKHTSRSFLTSVPHGAGGDGAASVKMLLCNSAAPTTVVVKRACRSAMALPAHGLATADPVCPSTIGIREGPQITLYRGKISATLAKKHVLSMLALVSIQGKLGSPGQTWAPSAWICLSPSRNYPNMKERVRIVCKVCCLRTLTRRVITLHQPGRFLRADGSRGCFYRKMHQSVHVLAIFACNTKSYPTMTGRAQYAGHNGAARQRPCVQQHVLEWTCPSTHIIGHSAEHQVLGSHCPPASPWLCTAPSAPSAQQRQRPAGAPTATALQHPLRLQPQARSASCPAQRHPAGRCMPLPCP